MPTKRGKRWVASGYDAVTKKKRYLSTHETKKEAAQAEAKWKLRTRATGRETCDEFAARWTTDYPRPRESTNLHNAERVQRFAKDFKGVKIADVDRPAARAWVLQHRSSLAAVRAMFGDAMRDGIIDTNPFSNLRLPGSRGRKDLVALTEPELVALADLALEDRMELGAFAPQYRAMILFAGYVGLRPGELFALPRENVTGPTCLIDRALSSRTGKIGQTKNGRSRTVIVPPAAQKALHDVPARPSGLVFASPADCMWTQPSHHRYWSRLRLIADRPGQDWYELRHCAATMLLERGVSAADVAVQLGHTDGGALVLSTYGHPSESGARARMLAAYGVQTDLAPAPTPIEHKRRKAG